MPYILDSYRISLDNCIKAIHQYLEIPYIHDELKLTMLHNVILKNVIYELKDFPFLDTSTEFYKYKLSRIELLENLIK